MSGKRVDSYGNPTRRRAEIATMYARGMTPKEIWVKISENPKYNGIAMGTIHGDIKKVRDKWSEALVELNSLENPRLEYEQRVSSLRELALEEARMDDGRMDVRNIKLASDLDKDIAKVKGVYNERLVIQIEDAQKLVAMMVDIIDQETSGDLRDKLMSKLLVVTEEL